MTQYYRAATSSSGGTIDFTTNNGTAFPIADVIRIVGDPNIQTSGSSNTVTITSAGAVTEQTSNYTADSTDYLILCTANSFTVTLPTAVGVENKIYQIKNTGSGTINIAADGSQTIDGESSIDIYQGENLTIISNNSDWYIL